MPDEILYCARCHRVILPREISDGNYHFVDGDAVCRDCFTRLSRRLRPVTGQRAESDTQPVPVDLSDLEKELSKGTSGLGPPKRLLPRQTSSSARLTPARRYAHAQTAFLIGCFVAGAVLGGWAYHAWYDAKRRAGEGQIGPDPKANPDGIPGLIEPRPNDPARPGPAGGDDGGPGLPPVPAGARAFFAEADAFVRGGRHVRESGGELPEVLLFHGSPDEEREGYVRFDLSALDREVAEARLWLYVLAADRLAPGALEVDLAADEAWDEKTLCWENRPRPGRTFAKSSPERGAVEVDVTAAVREALIRGRKVTLHLAIRQVGPGAGLRFASREQPREDRRPRLTVVPGTGPLPAVEPAMEPAGELDPPSEPAGPAAQEPPQGPAPGAAEKGTGLRGEYYAGMNFDRPVTRQVDRTVSFNWGLGVPVAGAPEDGFSVRWTGFVRPPETGRYTFRTVTDDGVRLWVDDKLIIDRWVGRKETEDRASVDLVAGRRHPIRMEYFDKTGEAVARLLWSGPGLAEARVIASEHLFPPDESGKAPAGE